MKEIVHPPDANSLLLSLRAIGYSIESAVADIIDNSISAKATNISLNFSSTPNPYIAILDDGNGMDKNELESAMRHGSSSPLIERSSNDLGRYGLGMKTASLSQCRRLTVISKKNNDLNGYVWDLDVIAKTGAWTMLELTYKEILSLSHGSEFMRKESGTLVIWNELDRVLSGDHDANNALSSSMASAAKHISLVFHRYLNTTDRITEKINISINASNIDGLDPLLSSHTGTQALPEEVFFIDSERVIVKPYILPHFKKLSPSDINKAGGEDGLRNQQGFYIYRNKRLIIWGSWFGLGRKDELSKLARVKVDISNKLDYLWTVDIKKATAFPPEIVKQNLRRTIDKIRAASGRTLVYRGRNESGGKFAPAWNEINDRDGFRFDINRSHPILNELSTSLDEASKNKLELLLKVIEVSFPIQSVYVKLAADQNVKTNNSSEEVEFFSLLNDVIINWNLGRESRDAFLKNLHLIEPFSANPQAAKNVANKFLEK